MTFFLINFHNLSIKFRFGEYGGKHITPPIVEVYGKYKGVDIKALKVIRLHGPDRSITKRLRGENWNKIYIKRQGIGADSGDDQRIGFEES